MLWWPGAMVLPAVLSVARWHNSCHFSLCYFKLQTSNYTGTDIDTDTDTRHTEATNTNSVSNEKCGGLLRKGVKTCSAALATARPFSKPA